MNSELWVLYNGISLWWLPLTLLPVRWSGFTEMGRKMTVDARKINQRGTPTPGVSVLIRLFRSRIGDAKDSGKYRWYRMGLMDDIKCPWRACKSDWSLVIYSHCRNRRSSCEGKLPTLTLTGMEGAIEGWM